MIPRNTSGTRTPIRAAICAQPCKWTLNKRPANKLIQLPTHFTRNEGVPGSSPGVGLDRKSLLNTSLFGGVMSRLSPVRRWIWRSDVHPASTNGRDVNDRCAGWSCVARPSLTVTCSGELVNLESTLAQSTWALPGHTPVPVVAWRCSTVSLTWAMRGRCTLDVINGPSKDGCHASGRCIRIGYFGSSFDTHHPGVPETSSRVSRPSSPTASSRPRRAGGQRRRCGSVRERP